MAIESACIPLPEQRSSCPSPWLPPREDGYFSLWGVSIAGGVRDVIGSAIAYEAGRRGGQPLAERLALEDHPDVGLRPGKPMAPAARDRGGVLEPPHLLVRTFISFPAGAARVPFGVFCLYTFIGSVIWSFVLAWVGVVLGEHWHDIRKVMRPFDVVIVAVILVLFVIWLRLRHRASAQPTPRR